MKLPCLGRKEAKQMNENEEEVLNHIDFTAKFVQTLASRDDAAATFSADLLRKKVRCEFCESVAEALDTYRGNGTFACPRCGEWWLRPKSEEA